MFVSYEHGLGLLIPWCDPQHVGVEPSQCLSVNSDSELASLLLLPCGPQRQGRKLIMAIAFTVTDACQLAEMPLAGASRPLCPVANLRKLLSRN